MEIVKRGMLPDTVEYTGICNHCETIVKFTNSEARKEFHRNERSLVVTCPVCGREIWTDY